MTSSLTGAGGSANAEAIYSRPVTVTAVLLNKVEPPVFTCCVSIPDCAVGAGSARKCLSNPTRAGVSALSIADLQKNSTRNGAFPLSRSLGTASPPYSLRSTHVVLRQAGPSHDGGRAIPQQDHLPRHCQPPQFATVALIRDTHTSLLPVLPRSTASCPAVDQPRHATSHSVRTP